MTPFSRPTHWPNMVTRRKKIFAYNRRQRLMGEVRGEHENEEKHDPFCILWLATASLCPSVCLYVYLSVSRPTTPFSTRPSDRNQIRHAYGYIIFFLLWDHSQLKKIDPPHSGVPGGILVGKNEMS